MPLHVSSTCAHHQEVKIALHSLWYHHTYRWPSRVHVLEHVEVWNKLIVKGKFCASSWLINETNIPRCTVSKTSKNRWESRSIFCKISTCFFLQFSISWEHVFYNGSIKIPPILRYEVFTTLKCYLPELTASYTEEDNDLPPDNHQGRICWRW